MLKQLLPTLARLAALAFLLSHATSAQAQETMARPVRYDTAAVRLQIEASERVFSVFRRGTAEDTAVYRSAIATLRLAHRIDSTYILPLQSAAGFYAALGETDSAVAVLEPVLDRAPQLSEFIAMLLHRQGRDPEARTWYERARVWAESVKDEWLDGPQDRGQAAFAGALIRLRFLARGPGDALATVAELPLALRETGQVRFAVCVVRHVNTKQRASGGSEASMPPSPLLGEAENACGELLNE